MGRVESADRTEVVAQSSSAWLRLAKPRLGDERFVRNHQEANGIGASELGGEQHGTSGSHQGKGQRVTHSDLPLG